MMAETQDFEDLKQLSDFIWAPDGTGSKEVTPQNLALLAIAQQTFRLATAVEGVLAEIQDMKNLIGTRVPIEQIRGWVSERAETDDDPNAPYAT